MSWTANRIVCVGEGMVELTPHHGGWDVSYGGDTLNVALHLTRLGHHTGFMTALGQDPFAGTMRADWAREGMDIALVLTHPVLTTGLYAIATDDRGERSFSYWRGQSAARAMFACAGAEEAESKAAQADLLFFSLISLAILPQEGRERLIGLAQSVRERGGRVAFDSNYRLRLWEDLASAQHWRDRAIAMADIGLPTLEDDRALGSGASADEIADYWARRGCGEVLVKLGSQGYRLPDGTITPPPELLMPLDTSGAGDAFDAGYLASRLRGVEPLAAAEAGQKLAAWTVMRAGAIPARDHAAPYGVISMASPE